MSWDVTLTGDIRLRLLQLLGAQVSFTANEVVLAQQLRMRYGHALAGDRLRTELAWLDEQGLVTLQAPGGVYLPTLTARGNDVACGLARVPGVATPLPGEVH